MTNRGLLQVIRRRKAWIAAGVLVGLLGAGLYSATAPRTYAATSASFFSLEYGNSAADLVQGSTYAQNQVASFALLATTPAVLQPVIRQFELPESPQAFAGRVQASAPVDTVMVEVTVTDSSPKRSAELADAVLASLSKLVEDLAPTNDQGSPTVRATTVAPADVPTGPASPDVVLALVLGLVAGLAAGVAAAFARAALDTRVRDADVLAEVTSRPVIGTVGVLPRGTGSSVVVARDPHGTYAESFRQLRTNLEFLAVPEEFSRVDRGARAFLVTSSSSGEGKSTVAANLAAALAETSASVLLVDADLRRPSMASVLHLEGVAGLTTVLLGQAALADVVQEWGRGGLHVLTSGRIPPNPVELLGSPAMAKFVDEVRSEYDYVVVDTAPLLPVADAAVLSRLVDGVMLVVNAGVTRRDQLAQSLRHLDQLEAPVMGIVLNAVERDEEAYSYRGSDAEPVLLAAVPVSTAAAGSRPTVPPLVTTPPSTPPLTTTSSARMPVPNSLKKRR
jgi:capsular exopolysaccharide synthesis family protein